MCAVLLIRCTGKLTWVLHDITAGGPDHLRIILEGESLLNDASSFTLFTIFVEFVVRAAESSGGIQSSAGAIVWKIIWKMAWLATGEFNTQGFIVDPTPGYADLVLA